MITHQATGTELTVKQLINRFLSCRICIVLFLIVALAGGGIAANMIHGVLVNMEKASQPEPTPTWYPEYPPLSQPQNPAEAAEMARGETLVKAGDCIACHTDTHHQGPTFAGGLPMQTPFGVIYAPNITPDPETGIGKWTTDQFVRAMQKGISPDGHYYYPAFPYLYFSRMPVEDLRAIKAYLDHIPAVHKPNVANEMVWPFSMRIMQLPWRILFFHPSEKEVFPSTQSSPVERGAYLVEGPGHCGMCHTPSWNLLTDKLPLGAPMRKYNLTGANVGGYQAPNISASNLGNIPINEITDVFLKDMLIGGGQVVGPMLEVNHDSLRYLSLSDLEAIAIYLKSVKSATRPKPTGSNAGKGIYEANCAGCHTAGAGGAPRLGNAADWAPKLKTGKETLYTNAIHGINGMPAKGACLSCTDDEIRKAVDFMVASVEGASAKAAPPIQKPLTLEDGQRIYAQNCSVCHATGFRNAPRPGDVAAFTPIAKEGFLNTFINVATGRNGHPVRGACPSCSDAEIKAAVIYMMQQSVPGKDYTLWQ